MALKTDIDKPKKTVVFFFVCCCFVFCFFHFVQQNHKKRSTFLFFSQTGDVLPSLRHLNTVLWSVLQLQDPHQLDVLNAPEMPGNRLNHQWNTNWRLVKKSKPVEEMILAEEVPGWCGWQGFMLAGLRKKKKKPHLADTVHYFFISTCTPLSFGPQGCMCWIASVAQVFSPTLSTYCPP